MIHQKEYFQNLYTDNKYIYSYRTKVAEIDHENQEVNLIAWNIGGRTSSPTTSKHINYITRLLNYKLNKNEKI